ncbi:MAG: DNA recombination/repair protein RecA, partial [Eubacterium sp.]|nr:DNA recombination/repair protein RecA [Eubacterium sp.]
GGRALKFYSSMRIDVRKSEQIKAPGNEFVGSHTKVKIVKNKVAPPFKTAEFDIMYGTGIDRVGEICDLAVSLGVIKKSGSWFSYGEQRFQGKDKVKELIKNDPEFGAEIEEQVLALMKGNDASAEAGADAPSSDAFESPKTPITQTRADAKAKLDIMIDDEDE